MTEPLSKAERLAIAGAVAPVVRRNAAAPRKVTVLDKDGKPVRETTHVEVTKAVLARSEIEFSVQEGKRPEWVKCKTCGAPVKVKRAKGPLPTACRPGTHRCWCGNPIMVAAGTCGAGKRCRQCLATERLTHIRKKGGVSRIAEDAFRAALSKAKSYRVAAEAMGVSTRAVFARAKRLNISPGGRA